MENLLALGTEEEKKIGREVTTFEKFAIDLKIENELDYAKACGMAKEIKVMQKKVEEYWEPMRESTYKAYKSVTDHKKSMLDPCKNAEKILKGKISDYQLEQDRKRREKEEELRRLAEAERDRKLMEAANAEVIGDVFGADAAFTEADIIEDAMAGGIITELNPSVIPGVSKTKSWKITGIDISKVPDSIFGMIIRPVDEKAVMNLIKNSKGTVQIPGIVYEETYDIRIRQ